jgi:hypothetical protein
VCALFADIFKSALSIPRQHYPTQLPISMHLASFMPSIFNNDQLPGDVVVVDNQPGFLEQVEM